MHTLDGPIGSTSTHLVIIRGNSGSGKSALAARIRADHRGSSHCYLYDLTFDETLRRYATRPVAEAFGEQEMRQWWRGFQPVDGLHERVIAQTDELESTVARVLDDCWTAAS